MLKYGIREYDSATNQHRYLNDQKGLCANLSHNAASHTFAEPLVDFLQGTNLPFQLGWERVEQGSYVSIHGHE